MPIITFSDDDILRNKIVTPSWYVLHIDRVGQKPAKGDNPDTTTLWPIDAKIVKNAENGSTDFAGVPVSFSFNDNPNAKGFILGFVAAMKGSDIKSGERIELAAAEGKKIVAFIKNDTYQGRVLNKVENQWKHYTDGE